MFNDGSHDFGYPYFMPKSIRIENLIRDDSESHKNFTEISCFGDPIGKAKDKRPFPYQLTEKIQIKGFKSNSGKSLQISRNPDVEKAVKFEMEG